MTIGARVGERRPRQVAEDVAVPAHDGGRTTSTTSTVASAASASSAARIPNPIPMPPISTRAPDFAANPAQP